MRESWTDERLDDFRVETARRFGEVDKRFDRVEKRLEGIEGELKTMHRTMAQGAIALTSAFLVGFASMIGLVATQL